MIKAAAAQIAPDLLSRSSTIGIVLDTMDEAHRNGANFIVFPESIPVPRTAITGTFVLSFRAGARVSAILSLMIVGVVWFWFFAWISGGVTN